MNLYIFYLQTPMEFDYIAGPQGNLPIDGEFIPYDQISKLKREYESDQEIKKILMTIDAEAFRYNGQIPLKLFFFFCENLHTVESYNVDIHFKPETFLKRLFLQDSTLRTWPLVENSFSLCKSKIILEEIPECIISPVTASLLETDMPTWHLFRFTETIHITDSTLPSDMPQGMSFKRVYILSSYLTNFVASESLEYLTLIEVIGLETLDLSAAKNLKELEVRGCKDLRVVRGVPAACKVAF